MTLCVPSGAWWALPPVEGWLLAGASRQVSHPPGGGGLLALEPLAAERMAQANGSGQAWLSFQERGLLSIRGTSKLLVGPRCHRAHKPVAWGSRPETLSESRNVSQPQSAHL